MSDATLFIIVPQCTTLVNESPNGTPSRGTQAPPRQGRRLVLRSEVEALLRERGAFEMFEQKWEQAVPAEDTTPLTDEEANAILHGVRRARRG